MSALRKSLNIHDKIVSVTLENGKYYDFSQHRGKSGPLVYPGDLTMSVVLEDRKDFDIPQYRCNPGPPIYSGDLSVSVTLEDRKDYQSRTFPTRLHAMLNDAEPKGFVQLVSWQNGGTAFKVHDPTKFTEIVLPQYFDQSKYKSFQRQLNMYGYKRTSKGPKKGWCHHKLFVRGQIGLCNRIVRRKTKERSSMMKMILCNSDKSMTSDEGSTSDCMVEAPKVDFEGQMFYPLKADGVPEVFPSDSQDPDLETVFTENDNFRGYSFPWKLHYILDEAEKHGKDNIISWFKSGRGFKVHEPDVFTREILHKLLGKKTKWQSFQRQLLLYGFRRFSSGPYKGIYVHKCGHFVRGQQALCRKIKRITTSSPSLSD
jgi:hypothetical protein